MNTFSHEPSLGPYPATDEFRAAAEINVTPLVDVMLVLLTIFMVTAPMLAAGMKVNLPNARSARSLDTATPIVVTITREGAIAVDDVPTPPGELGFALKSRMGSDPAHVIHLRGDRDAPYGTIVEVIDELARHGLTRFVMRTNAQDASRNSARLP